VWPRYRAPGSEFLLFVRGLAAEDGFSMAVDRQYGCDLTRGCAVDAVGIDVPVTRSQFWIAVNKLRHEEPFPKHIRGERSFCRNALSTFGVANASIAGAKRRSTSFSAEDSVPEDT
jgi:hypothetical protein